MSPSFIHAASAKIIADRLHERHNISRFGHKPGDAENDASTIMEAGLRCLLVEEKLGTIICGHNPSGDQIGRNSYPCSNLALSLAMDAARAAVSSSVIPCRGCRNNDSGVSSSHTQPKGKNHASNGSLCQCCKVAILIPSLDFREENDSKQPKKKTKRRQVRTKTAFPMPCTRKVDHGSADKLFNNIVDESKGKWDPQTLNNIHVQYVNSIKDVIRYLAYAPSLPDHFQPLDGIFLLGIGNICSRDCGSGWADRDVYKMEISHVLSTLADTGNALEDNRRQVVESSATIMGENLRNNNENNHRLTLMATIDQSTYSSMTQKMQSYFHQWVDFTASIESIEELDALNSSYDAEVKNILSSWELCFQSDSVAQPDKNTSKYGRKEQFRFHVVETVDKNDSGLCHELSWMV